MRTRTKRFSTVVAMALAAVSLALPALAGSSNLVVQGSAPHGSLVTVSVKNTSMLPRVGTVMVQANVGGIQVLMMMPVMLSGGQSMDVNLGFSSTVSCVTSVSIQDSPVPM